MAPNGLLTCRCVADRDARYSLAGLVEMDDSFFGPKGTKRGRNYKNLVFLLMMIFPQFHQISTI